MFTVTKQKHILLRLWNVRTKSRKDERLLSKGRKRAQLNLILGMNQFVISINYRCQNHIVDPGMTHIWQGRTKVLNKIYFGTYNQCFSTKTAIVATQNAIREFWNISQKAQDNKEKMQALEHYLDCHKGLCIMLKEGGEKLETLTMLEWEQKRRKTNARRILIKIRTEDENIICRILVYLY